MNTIPIKSSTYTTLSYLLSRGKTYHSAYNRGVKIIGATSHYVTEELDAGPIIAQDITQVSHLHSVGDFIAKGRDLERIVLSKAIQLHTNRKVMVYQNKTVIFS